MHPHAELLNRFYTAFAALDADTMAACYAPEARFQDEVFHLNGREEVAGMWRMLCAAVRAEGDEDWSLTFRDIDADDRSGRAHWEPRYRFSATGRRVHNIIDGVFEFRDGRILAHRDRFDFWRWSRQALGPAGWLLGWSPLLRRKVQAQAMRNLRVFLDKLAG
jgi:limonene-1,2-epoxide hydrolase